ncbi:hypothetical protein ACWC1D_25570 [Streptomyces sp. NPDC001478]
MMSNGECTGMDSGERAHRKGGELDLGVPHSVPLDTASKILGIAGARGRELAKIDGYPVETIDEGGPLATRFTVATALLVRHASLGRVREVLGVQG